MAPSAATGTTPPPLVQQPPQGLSSAPPTIGAQQQDVPEPKSSAGHDYKGFVAGVFSGVAKLTGKGISSPSISLRYSGKVPLD